MGCFREQILRSRITTGDDMADLLSILNSVILDQVQMDRDGVAIDKHLIKANVYMLEALYTTEQELEEEKLYLRFFEEQFLQTSAEFYRQEADRLLKETDAGTYCRHAKSRLDEESDRCRSTLSEGTAPKIQAVVEAELIQNRIKALIDMDSGVRYMIDNDKLADLGLVFDLQRRVDAKKAELTRAVQRIVREMGEDIAKAVITAAQAPPAAPTAAPEEGEADKSKIGATRQVNQQTVAALKWAEDTLTLKDRFDKICKDAFLDDQVMSTALTKSMAENINSFPRSSEYISLFIDENMKKGVKNRTEKEVDVTLDKAIVLLRYLQDKDIFETYYKKHLCKRLLLSKSQSLDVEKQMIMRMKIELGNNFTTKLEIMFKDMTLSEELTNNYRKRLADADPKRIDLSVNVLTKMSWPLEAFKANAEDDPDGKVSIIYAPEVERVKNGFESFYASQYTGRKLTWQTNMGDADIKATFAAKSGTNGKPRVHDINCSSYAMLVLLLFNDTTPGATLTLEEIQAKTNIPINALCRNLQSLAVAPKTRFLVKEPMSRDVKPGDRFSFNENFTSKFTRIKVGVVSAGNKVESDKERKETEKKNDDNRSFAIEAAVVRIMKYVFLPPQMPLLAQNRVKLRVLISGIHRSRKELSHAQLLQQTIEVLSHQFKPDVNMIKKRIESLIEREYLERIEEAAVPSYRYLA
jgi:cullin 3